MRDDEVGRHRVDSLQNLAIPKNIPPPSLIQIISTVRLLKQSLQDFVFGGEIMKHCLAILATVALTGSVAAESVTSYETDDSFEDVTFAVESAIIGRGLVIDYVSHVGEMLSRTGEDVGSDIKLYEAADVFLFCSAVTSRNVMEEDPMNIAYCPYGIFVADTGDEVIVGFRDFPSGAMQEVQVLLDEIVQEAVGSQ